MYQVTKNVYRLRLGEKLNVGTGRCVWWGFEYRKRIRSIAKVEGRSHKPETLQGRCRF